MPAEIPPRPFKIHEKGHKDDSNRHEIAEAGRQHPIVKIPRRQQGEGTPEILRQEDCD